MGVDRDKVVAMLRAVQAGTADRPSVLDLSGAWLVDADLSELDLSGYACLGPT